MRVGITGSSGLIGSALVSALRERGDDVVTFVRPDTAATFQPSIRWNPVSRDVDQGDLNAAGELDAVVNLAGTGIADKRWNESRKHDILASRVALTGFLSEVLLAMATPPAFVASGSAIGVYGSCGDEILTEASPPGRDFLATVCTQWEKACEPLSASGIGVAHLRTGIVQSARGGALKKQLPLFRAGAGGVLGNGRQWVSPISLHDEVRAIIFLLDHRVTGAFNLVCPTPLTNRDYTKILAAQLHRPSIASVPTAALKIALGAELVSGAVLASQRVLPTLLTSEGFVFDDVDTSAILVRELA